MGMSPGDVLFVRSSGYLNALAHVGSAGGFAGHVMLVVASPRVVIRGSPGAHRFEVLWPAGDVHEIWRVQIVESLRGETGLHELEVLLHVEPRTGQLVIFGDVSSDGQELGQMDDGEVVELWQSPEMLHNLLQPELVAEVLADMKKCAASWSLTTAIRAVFMSADAFNGSDSTDLFGEITDCWHVDPICTSVVIIFWQRYLCELARTPNTLPHAPSQRACLDLILKWMPLKADRGLPSELLQTMQRCGWIQVQKMGNVANVEGSCIVGPSSECVKPSLPIVVDDSMVDVPVDMRNPSLDQPCRRRLSRIDQLVSDACQPCIKAPAKMVEAPDELRNLLRNSLDPSGSLRFVSAARSRIPENLAELWGTPGYLVSAAA